MGIYLGDKQGTLYKGSYKPVNLYHGDKKAAGWELSEKTGTELSWDDTYNDKVLSAVVEGKSEQAVTVETITNALAPYIVPLRYGAGAVDMSVRDMTNARWLYNGTIYTASRLRLTVQDGDVIYLLVDAFGYATEITNNFIAQPYAGDLSDLQGKITYYLGLSNCSLVTGVYTPDGNGMPTYTYLDYTGLSAADMDATLIAYAATTKSNGTFYANGMTRTSASDAAVSTLQERGWSVTGITKV